MSFKDNTDNNNIILIGMPASGKSTLGVILAKVLGYNFIDSDILIQEKQDRKLSQIIEEDGIDSFIEIENEVNASIDVKRTVIATGGSAVYGEKAMQHFKNIGRVVYLHVEYDRLVKRLSDIKQRGVVIRDGQTFEQLYDERVRLYNKYADITVTENCENVEKVLADLIKELGEA
jgi:shikimate kinase